MDFYSELKSKNDILVVANELGYNGSRSGSCYQGDCPKHGSTHGVCLVIWPKIQGFKCYHCGKTGDVIDLVMLYKKLDHRGAVKYLADRAGIALYNGKELTPEEVAQREAALNEKILVENMLTEAAEWYHGQLKNYPQILDHLRNHYRFSQEIMDELKIGFAPPVPEGSDSTLASHLNSNPAFQGKLYLSGLFVFKILSGPYTYFFNGRIVFPYWKAGKVVYMTARATDLTPPNEYECYYSTSGEMKVDEKDRPLYIKYKKLLTHDPNHSMRINISKFIQNETFMGEDTIRGEKEIIITEGAPDWVSAVDKGFAVISPVTTRFREEDHEKLAELTSGAESIYIINDNEESEAGRDGALKTAKYLTQKGKNVFLVELPRPEDTDKIDLNEYFLKHTAEDLHQLMSSSKSLLEILIDDLPGDFIKAQPAIREDIAPLLLDLDEARLEHLLETIKKKVKTNRKALDAELEAARIARQEAESKTKEEPQIDPEVEKDAQTITMDPLLFKKRIDAVAQLGVVGERGNIAMCFCALDSRLLPYNAANPNALAIKIAGHFGSGKSHVVKMCMQVYPESCYHMVTNGSGKSMYYLKGGLKHKALVVTEAYQFQKDNAGDSELVYSIRTLLSEGRLSYLVVAKDNEGNLATFEKKLEGPTSFITTTVAESLEPQMEDRLFTVHPDESPAQTKAIGRMVAEQKAGIFEGLDPKKVDSWKVFHELLKPVDVVVPFAPSIMDFLEQTPNLPISTRRAANRMLTVIQTIACAYQYQREKDSKGRVIAEIADYWMAYQVVQEAFRENMGAQDKKTEQYLTAIREKERITPGNLAKMFGVSGSAVSNWVWRRVEDGMIEWCDENGYHFVDDNALKKAKHQGVAYLKVTDSFQNETVRGLPTPFDLTGDSRWDEGGDLLNLYDLDLEKRASVSRVFIGVNPVFTPALNTVSEDEIFNIIQYSGDEPDGVNVFTQIQGGKGNKFEKAQEGPGIGQRNGDLELRPDNGHGTEVDTFFKGFEGALL
jgi:DNA primase